MRFACSCSSQNVPNLYPNTVDNVSSQRSVAVNKFLSERLCAHVQTSVHEASRMKVCAPLSHLQSGVRHASLGHTSSPRGRTYEVPSHLSTLGFYSVFLCYSNTPETPLTSVTMTSPPGTQRDHAWRGGHWALLLLSGFQFRTHCVNSNCRRIHEEKEFTLINNTKYGLILTFVCKWKTFEIQLD